MSAFTLPNGRVVELSVLWNANLENAPELIVHDPEWSYPDTDAPIWERDIEGHVWHVDTAGYIHYLYMGNGIQDNKRGLRGYGGQMMTRRLTTGDVVWSNDCWSSRCAVIPVPCTEVVVNTGQGHRASGIRMDIFQDMVASLGLYLVEDWEGRPVEISTRPDRAEKLEVNRPREILWS